MAKRIDANQAAIVEALRGCGYSVAISSMMGHGYPDIAVGCRGKTLFMEIKAGSNCLTPDEREWKDNWKGSYVVVRSVEQAIREMEDFLEE